MSSNPPPLEMVGESAPARDDAQQLLQDLIQLATVLPSFEHLERLAFAVSVKTATALHHAVDDGSLPVAYLRAAARQLRADAASVATSLAARNKMVDCIRMILPVVSNCIVQCASQRSVIKETGILESLWALVEKEERNRLSVLLCEFLQACIYANEYRLAYPLISDTWPLPTKDLVRQGEHLTTPAELVLRYYYLRGIVCMGCHSESHAALAIRCFWTCLSVPVASDANAVSAIAVAAWKKMVLLQCLSPIGILCTTAKGNVEPASTTRAMTTRSMHLSASVGAMPTTEKSAPTFTNPLSTPNDMAWDLVRFLSQAKAPPNARFAKPSSGAALRSSSAVAEEGSIQHVIEMDTATSGLVRGDNNLGVASGCGGEVPGASTETLPVPANTAPAAPPLYYPSLGVFVYKQLVQAFVNIDREKFDAILEECHDLFENDGNLGLVRRVGVALLHRQLLEWSRVYGTIPLEDLAKEMNVPSHVVQASLVELQTKMAWPVQLVPSATDDGPSSITVVFPPELPRPKLDAETADLSLVHQLKDLTATVRQLDAAIAASRKYKNAVSAASTSDRRNVTAVSVLGPINVEEL